MNLIESFFRYDVVSCLSEHVRNDTLKEVKQRIEKPCQRQLKVELLERVSGIKMILKILTKYYQI